MEKGFSQISYSAIGGLIVLVMHSWTKEAGVWVTVVSTILALAVLYGLSKSLKPTVTWIVSMVIHKTPSLRDLIERMRRDFIQEKKFNIACLWALTWFMGALTPIFLMIPFREEVKIPAELLSVAGVVALVPVTLVMSYGLLRVTWQDWKRSETKKQKVFWGIRVLGVIALAAAIPLVG